jgi:hypothetical protein
MSILQELQSAHRQRLARLGALPPPRRVALPPPPPVEEPEEPEPQVSCGVLDELRIRRPFIRTIIGTVAAHHGLSMIEICSDRRSPVVARPRQIAMYLAKVMTIESMPKIGRVFGRDHTTVLHGVRRIKALYDADPDFAAEVETIRSKVAR